MKFPILVLLALGAGACNLIEPVMEVEETEASEPATLPSQSAVPDATLVPADEPGTIRVVEEPLREVSGVTTGKVRLLELYRTAVADREMAEARLAACERERDESRAALAARTLERDAAATRASELDARVQELESRALDLARRLAESEIARLEARKSELEHAASSGTKERP